MQSLSSSLTYSSTTSQESKFFTGSFDDYVYNFTDDLGGDVNLEEETSQHSSPSVTA